jgi:hypothetical protein
MNHDNKKTKELIYKLMTTSTGIHMLDSGGDNGRMWQRNQKKSFTDFQNEEAVTYDIDGFQYELTKDGEHVRSADTENELLEWLQRNTSYSWDHAFKHEGYKIVENKRDSTDINCNVSIFHYLPTVLELDEVCDEFNALECKEWNSDIYGISEDQQKWLEARGFEAGESWNTYNGESFLSQVLQGTELKQDGSGSGEYVLIQIHNGADVRGGYTDAKLFKYRAFQEFLNPLPLIDGEIDGTPVSSVYNGTTLHKYDMEEGETNEPVLLKKDSIIKVYLADL